MYWKRKSFVFPFLFLDVLFKVFELPVRNIWAQGQRTQVWVEGEQLSPCSEKPEKELADCI